MKGTSIRDVRNTVRPLWKSPAVTLTSVVCPGQAIGANPALFSIFNAVLWKPLPAGRPMGSCAEGPDPDMLDRGCSFSRIRGPRAEHDVLSGLVARRGVQVACRTGQKE